MRDFHSPGRSPVLAMNGMAATSMPAATLTAIDILRSGGNALDAAIAACAVLAVIEPQSTGIGGDCFCLYAPAGTGKVVAINGSGRAPAGATPERLRADGLTAMVNTSAHSVTVPGAISAWEKLNKAHGKLPLAQLLAPAIKLAENGHPVHARVASDWASAAPKLAKNAAAAKHFLKDGKAYGVGEVFRQLALAATMRAIGEQGAKAFYTGPIAADMVAALRAAGGSHTEEDFANGLDAAEFVAPIQTSWRGLDVFQCPPNGSGMLVLQMLGVLGQCETPAGGPMSIERVHRHVEAARLAYRDRDAFLADPAKADVPVARLTSAEYTSKLRALISDDKAMPELPPAGAAEWLPKHRDTVYLCVVDSDGNACSFINSLFESFGSGILAEQSGVMLQNRGFGFRLQEGHPNCIAPNKRPMHTIIPGMVMQNGRAIMPYGVMGGHFQPMGQTWFLANHFEFGMDVQEALDYPRLFPYAGKLQMERGFSPAMLDQLSRRGHTLEMMDKPHGGGQAILIDHQRGVLIGGSDPRKDGCALGY